MPDDVTVDAKVIEERTVTAWQAFMADPDNREAATAREMWTDPKQRLAFLHGVRFTAAQAMQSLEEAIVQAAAVLVAAVEAWDRQEPHDGGVDRG